MKPHLLILCTFFMAFAIVACKKAKQETANTLTYFQVGFKEAPADWRDSSFVIATSNPERIAAAKAQLQLPVSARQLVFGDLASGSGGYNKNATHQFSWHLKEDNWKLVDATIEIYDGRPYSDVDKDTAYWLNTMTRYGSWNSYIKSELPKNQLPQ